MQEMNEETIRSFFTGHCTQEEAARVLQYLKQHPDHPSLLAAWDEADPFTPLPGHYTEEMREVVIARTDPAPAGKMRLRWLAAAACLLALCITAWLWRGTGTPVHPGLARTSRPRTEWMEHRNNTLRQLVVVMADSSRITLSPQAWIRYRENFTSGRDVYMKGDVFFEVAKDKEHPFTVYSGYISTTALGTAFRVTAPDRQEGIKVRLNEGKVRVAMTGTAIRQSDYYLLPGQELVFHARDRPGVLHSFFVKVGGRKAPAAKQGSVAGPGESYLFNNQTLPDVLDQLSVIYGVRFRYSAADLGRIYFVGKVERNDSIEKTLGDIALLNQLSLTREKDGFVLESRK